jgi:thiamine biosynthesis protein ThiS
MSNLINPKSEIRNPKWPSVAIGRVGAVEIRLNGKTREVADGITVRRLLDDLGLHPLRVAVQRNEDIVKRDRYEEVVLQSGDTVEILTIMAGG